MREENLVIYIKANQQNMVNSPQITMKDLCSVSCQEPAVAKEICEYIIYEFKPQNHKSVYKKVFSILDIIEIIQRRLKKNSISIVSLGASDVLIEYKSSPKPGRIVEAFKIILVSVLIFFGAAFTIMAFNNDISITGVFEQFYEQMTGQKKPPLSELEVTYAIGLAIGIVVFFNHIGKYKLTDDVTPVEVEINKHNKDTYDTIISNSKKNQED